MTAVKNACTHAVEDRALDEVFGCAMGVDGWVGLWRILRRDCEELEDELRSGLVATP